MIEEIKKYLTPILFFIIGVLIFTQIESCESSKKESQILQYNITALKDSNRVIKNKVGELESVRLSLIGDKEDLAKLNLDLRKELDKEHGKVKFITKVKTVFKKDTIRITDSQKVSLDTSNKVYGISWFTTKFADGLEYSIFGETKFKVDTVNSLFKILPIETVIYNNKIKFRTIFGYTEVENGYQVFIRSNNPDVTFDIEGGFIDKSMVTSPQDTFVVGPYLGGGLSADGKPQPQIGFGVMYKLFGF